MRMREIRKAMSLTQAEISRLTGLNQATICRIESGEINPSLATVQSIAKALHCTVGNLVGETAFKPARRRAGRPS